MTQAEKLAAEIDRVAALRAEWTGLSNGLDAKQREIGSAYRVTVNITGALKEIDADLARARLALQTDDDVQRAVEIGTLKRWK